MSAVVGRESAEREARIALACLPSMYPNRLRSLLRFHSGVEAIELLRHGRRLHPEIESTTRAGGIDRLRAEAREIESPPPINGGRGGRVVVHADVDAETAVDSGAEFTSGEFRADECGAVGCSSPSGVVVLGDAEYPSVLAADPEAPEVLFFVGDLALLQRRRVGVVGTRNATAAGRATAVQLGSELAAAGITVVSGLARGIDAAAHRGVREAGSSSAVAVVGSGLDQIYPKANRVLWEWVASEGLILSEFPPGSAPEAWHFPLRNRVIAALSEVVVVVESRETGGSLITVEAALQRGIDVMAVPGSRYCRASVGTNQLIAEGAGLVRDIDDILVALQLATSPPSAGGSASPSSTSVVAQPHLPGLGPPPAMTARSQMVLDVCSERPVTIDEIVEVSGLGVIEVARAIAELEQVDLIKELNGWIESTGSRLGCALPSDLGGDEPPDLGGDEPLGRVPPEELTRRRG